ncbi:MAG: HEAT repeat domain-containing protein [Gammaproteobacteria bacterium]|nr:HEAT repeat domain-containing protein [Gammaproteobacteria bacterium]
MTLPSCSAEAIGAVGQASAEVPVELVDGPGDDDALVRQYAAISVGRLGARAGALPRVVDALKENLVHGHHHVRGWSIEALRRLGTAEALNAAVDYLVTARWDFAPWSGEPWEYDLKRAPTRGRHLLLNSWDP